MFVKDKPVRRKPVMPIGDVLMAGTDRERTELWWCPPEHIQMVQDEVNKIPGVKLCLGKAGNGTDYMPEVIGDAWQERRPNGTFVPSCRMDVALKGDILVWLDIEDEALAIASAKKYTAIPCPVRVDMIKYNDNPAYKDACDTINSLFAYYYRNGRPYDNTYVEAEDC